MHCLSEARRLVAFDCQSGFSTPDSAVGGLLVLRPRPLTEPRGDYFFADHFAVHFKSYGIDLACGVRLVFVFVMVFLRFECFGELRIYLSQTTISISYKSLLCRNNVPIKAECTDTCDEV